MNKQSEGKLDWSRLAKHFVDGKTEGRTAVTGRREKKTETDKGWA
jgi:hypothetical protein